MLGILLIGAFLTSPPTWGSEEATAYCTESFSLESAPMWLFNPSPYEIALSMARASLAPDRYERFLDELGYDLDDNVKAHLKHFLANTPQIDIPPSRGRRLQGIPYFTPISNNLLGTGFAFGFRHSGSSSQTEPLSALRSLALQETWDFIPTFHKTLYLEATPPGPIVGKVFLPKVTQGFVDRVAAFHHLEGLRKSGILARALTVPLQLQPDDFFPLLLGYSASHPRPDFPPEIWNKGLRSLIWVLANLWTTGEHGHTIPPGDEKLAGEKIHSHRNTFLWLGWYLRSLHQKGELQDLLVDPRTFPLRSFASVPASISADMIIEDLHADWLTQINPSARLIANAKAKSEAVRSYVEETMALYENIFRFVLSANPLASEHERDATTAQIQRDLGRADLLETGHQRAVTWLANMPSIEAAVDSVIQAASALDTPVGDINSLYFFRQWLPRILQSDAAVDRLIDYFWDQTTSNREIDRPIYVRREFHNFLRDLAILVLTHCDDPRRTSIFARIHKLVVLKIPMETYPFYPPLRETLESLMVQWPSLEAESDKR